MSRRVALAWSTLGKVRVCFSSLLNSPPACNESLKRLWKVSQTDLKKQDVILDITVFISQCSEDQLFIAFTGDMQ